ncbi:MAG: DUF1553 domain-containing protein, partial [Planctomycetota bacterium]|nr:DUF1553 domain-containing protein [Planctomycetota bacterium]
RGYRFAPRGEYERIADFETTGGPVEVKFEVFAGGREGKTPRRVEVGETVVAIAKSESDVWELLTPGLHGVRYTDADWANYREGLEKSLAEWNAATRARLRENSADYWTQRRNETVAWLATTPEVAVPVPPAGFPIQTPIDNFIADRYASVRNQNLQKTPDKIDFFRDVSPLLESRCIDCHRGANAKGGFRLDRAEAARRGGESGPAFQAGVAESELLRRVTSHDPGEMMPPKGERLSAAEISVLERWISEGASWPDLPLLRDSFSGPVDDAGFLRRVMLDTVGVPPTLGELGEFLAETRPDKRSVWIDRLLDDPRWADHWMALWQDMLAENPNILNPTLNNTGPFRWWLYESLRDDLPLDRMVTQLVLQRGGDREGGPAGFGEASQNDVPYAAKGAILSAAFLGVDLKCARCHDSPTGTFQQEQLFQIGALLAAKPLDVPATSSVDPGKLQTLGPEDHRERLAALLTAPHNERFAQVLANHIWRHFMGRGIVEPVEDWEQGTPTHPELLRWLGRELVRSGYQIKSLSRLILNSAAYQRAVDPLLRTPDPLYAAPEPRRLSAEQIVDSLFAVSGKPFRTEPLCLDLNGRRVTSNSIDLGTPRRAWMLSSLSNERDRPSLSLPRLQAVADVLTALGWRGARQDPSFSRDASPNALQPAILANGVMMQWITRLSDDHGLTEFALREQPVETLVDNLFLRLLSRVPTPPERTRYAQWLSDGYVTRRVANPVYETPAHVAPKFITWTNHLQPESDPAAQERIAAAQRGDPPTPQIEPNWRARCEDAIWAILNSPEMLFRP